MIAGLPGTGIGGLFYIASALWMPVHRALHGRGDGRHWPRAFAQGLIAGGILWSLAATGWLLSKLIAPVLVAALPVHGATMAQQAETLFRWVAVFGTAGVLLAVLIVVELARLVVRRRPGPARARVATLRIEPNLELPDVA